MQSQRKSVILIFLPIFLSGLLLPDGVSAAGYFQAEVREVVQSAVDYLQSQQLDDGGIAGLSGVSDAGTSARAILALKVNQIDPNTLVNESGISLVDYLNGAYPEYITDSEGLIFPGNAGLVLAALALTDQPTESLAADLLNTLQPDGSFATEASSDWNSGAATDLNQAFAILGLSLAGQELPENSIDYLLNRQLEDGTWDNGFGSDPDTTAITVIALLASGQVEIGSPAIEFAIDYFRNTQLDNGGWRPTWDTDEINVDTTGWIIHALITANEDLTEWQKANNHPVESLAEQQKEDGSIGGTYVNAYSTVEAMLGLTSTSLVSFVTIPEVSPIDQVQENQAGLVIGLPDGSTILRCVNFDTQTVTGFELLERSNLSLETINDPAMGPGICGIESQGCPSNDCFCGAPNYWSYWHWENGAWVYSQVGAATFEVNDGALEGWNWGENPPSEISFEDVCGEDAKVFIPSVIGESIQETEPTQTKETAISENQESDEEEGTNRNNLPVEYLIFGGILAALIVLLIFFIWKKKI